MKGCAMSELNMSIALCFNDCTLAFCFSMIGIMLEYLKMEQLGNIELLIL